MQIQNQSNAALTLIDLMIVVATIALIASIAVPNYFRAHRRAQAKHELENLRLLDEAVHQYSIDSAKKPGMHAVFGDLKNYLKTGTPLHSSGADILGNPYGAFTVGSFPKVNPATFDALSDVADEAFWSPSL